jgi:hypothetical protein
MALPARGAQLNTWLACWRAPGGGVAFPRLSFHQPAFLPRPLVPYFPRPHHSALLSHPAPLDEQPREEEVPGRKKRGAIKRERERATRERARDTCSLVLRRAYACSPPSASLPLSLCVSPSLSARACATSNPRQPLHVRRAITNPSGACARAGRCFGLAASPPEGWTLALPRQQPPPQKIPPNTFACPHPHPPSCPAARYPILTTTTKKAPKRVLGSQLVPPQIKKRPPRACSLAPIPRRTRSFPDDADYVSPHDPAMPRTPAPLTSDRVPP